MDWVCVFVLLPQDGEGAVLQETRFPLVLLDMTAYLEYLILQGFRFIINLLPEGAALWIGRQLGRSAFHLDREHRRVALRNLLLAFGNEKSMEELRSIAKKTFEHLGMTAVEFFRIPGTDLETLKKKLTVEGLENVRELLDNRKKGALILLSHMGNWELMGFLTKILGYPLSVIARPVKKNPWVDRLVSEIRSATGIEVIFTEKASRKVIQALSRNRLVGILIDQRAKRSEGVWVDFFGKKAPTTPSLAILAMRTGAPVVPVFMVRDGYGKHRVLIEKPLEIVHSGDIKKDIETNTQRINQTLESVIRRFPDQWFWVHRRWERKEKIHPK
jgi:KDO2-lipid IV(A) lauroyltransferase